jgi:hypothetical protein
MPNAHGDSKPYIVTPHINAKREMSESGLNRGPLDLRQGTRPARLSKEFGRGPFRIDGRHGR